MMKHFRAFLAALLFCSTTAASIASLPASAAEGSYDMGITVDLSSSGKAISPYIYGVNIYGNEDVMKDLHATAVRQGGNRMTAYNWETNASNAGSDWKHSSDDNLSKSDEPADCAQQLSKQAQECGVPYKFTTLQLAGYVAADKNGEVSEEEAAPSDRWNEVKLTKGSDFADTPDLTDGTVYMDEYVNYLVNLLGDATTPTGMQGYSLDNEPALWSFTHSRMHPQPVGIEELQEKSIEMAKAVKKIDPAAEVFGPALYGYTAFDHLADDENSSEWETIKAEGGYHWYLDCYLDAMSKAEKEAGVRLLDVLDIHYYSESARVGAEDRVQSVRTLYEKGFAENSWIGEWCQENVPILPTIQNSIDTYYPGTKLAISEYNFGGDTDVSGTIAQAEALGCYADQGVYLATLWGGGAYIYSGIQLYTNYDGNGAAFGDTLMPTVTEDVSLSSAYAAVDADDDSEVTVMVTNKNMTESENAVIKLDGAKKSYQSAAVYAVYGDSEKIRLLDKVKDVQDNQFSVTLPAFSAAMVVVSEDPNAFDDLVQPAEPKVETEVFDDPDSLINENGFVAVPITDPEHLAKITVTADVTSTAGSTWGTAGCAACANVQDADGNGFWSSKSYSLSLGSDTVATIAFDGTFDDEDGNSIPATVADGKVELQMWWSASEKQEADVGDEIQVHYKKIEVTYEYPAEEPPQETTTADSGSAETTTAAVEEGLPGDVDCNGKLTLPDAVLMARLAVSDETAEVSETGMRNADYNKNAEINSEDTVLLLQFLVGIEE